MKSFQDQGVVMQIRSYIEPLQERYQQLQAREQWLLKVAAVVVPLLLLVFAVILPVMDQQQALKKSLAVLQQQADEAERLAHLLVKQGGAKQRSGTADTLLSRVEQQARQSHVRNYMTRIKPQPSPTSKSRRLMLQMRAVPYDDLLRFVAALAAGHISIHYIKLQAAAKAGHVDIYAVVDGGSL